MMKSSSAARGVHGGHLIQFWAQGINPCNFGHKEWLPEEVPGLSDL